MLSDICSETEKEVKNNKLVQPYRSARALQAFSLCKAKKNKDGFKIVFNNWTDPNWSTSILG